jgi:dihydropteroate synthase
MGVINVTPDSFSDGGQHLTIDHAIHAATSMAAAGAMVLDLGAESTRPGSQPVTPDEQCTRLLPVLRELPTDLTGIISIDTTSSQVIRRCHDLLRQRGSPQPHDLPDKARGGLLLANDVSAGLSDPDMLPTVAELGIGIILMHMRGTPATMQNLTDYSTSPGGVVAEVIRHLRHRAQAAIDAGIPASHILLDPGIGFAKTTADNLKILQSLPALCALGYPVVVGASRKRFIGELCHRPDPKSRLAGSLAAAIWAATNGAAMVRVHDVPETIDALRITTAIRLP